MPYGELIPFDLSFMKTAPPLEYATRLHQVADAFLAHPGFQGDFPQCVADGHALKQCATEFTVVAQAASSGDRNKVAERDTLRPKTSLRFIASLHWAAIRAHGEDNPSLIANLGVEQKKKAAARKKNPEPLGAPLNLQIKHGQSGGSMVLKTNRVRGAITYHVDTCKGLPTGDDSWTSAGEFHTSGGMTITGLEPGQEYYFRVRCFGAAGHGPWSAVVNLRAL